MTSSVGGMIARRVGRGTCWTYFMSPWRGLRADCLCFTEAKSHFSLSPVSQKDSTWLIF